MLITEFVEISLSGNNLKYYKNLGYNIPEKISGVKFKKISVSVNDLPPGSNVLVECRCDGICGGKILQNISWCDYKKQVKNDGKYYCQNCAMKLYASENSRLTRLHKSLSFEERLILDNRQDILNRWDYELNKNKKGEILYPSDVNSKSNVLVYIKCPKGIHKSEIKNVVNFIVGHEGSMDCIQCNSLGYNYPEVLSIWSDKNEISPYEYDQYSSRIVWWKCLENKHEDYRRTIVDSSKTCNFRCPECTQERKDSFLQEKVRTYLNFISNNCSKESGFIKIIREYDKDSLVCFNPKTKRKLPYDNEIIHKNFKLIIEVQGQQHYNKNNWSNLSFNPNEMLEYIQWKDQYKKDYALSQGYYYLEIPYWTEKDGTWRELIDNKLEEIYNDINNN